jgi:hypothetical protein
MFEWLWVKGRAQQGRPAVCRLTERAQALRLRGDGARRRRPEHPQTQLCHVHMVARGMSRYGVQTSTVAAIIRWAAFVLKSPRLGNVRQSLGRYGYNVRTLIGTFYHVAKK